MKLNELLESDDLDDMMSSHEEFAEYFPEKFSDLWEKGVELISKRCGFVSIVKRRVYNHHQPEQAGDPAVGDILQVDFRTVIGRSEKTRDQHRADVKECVGILRTLLPPKAAVLHHSFNEISIYPDYS